MAAWHTVESARDSWEDAPLDDTFLSDLLTVAQEQIIAYAPALRDEEGTVLDPLDESTDLPTSWKYFQLMQARNIWNASMVDAASGGIGGDDYVLRPHPLDWVIRQGLRPRRGVPVLG